MYQFPDWQRENWIEAQGNPVVNYRTEDGVKTAIGDPTVLIPGEFDDGWHLFCHGFRNDNYAPRLFHFVSENGDCWDMKRMVDIEANPTYLFRDGSRWILYYTAALLDKTQQEKYGAINVIRARVSDDLENWSEPVDLLMPELPWERETDPSEVWRVEVRNPCVCKLPNGRYRMYYSGGTVLLRDCGYEEPKYIGYAESDSPLGPFVKAAEPILGPDAAMAHRNYGAGAPKVFRWREQFLGLYNSIYVDENQVSRSAINLLLSSDGISWEEAPFNPIILPTDKGWNSNLIYQLDLVQLGDELRIYYNARSGAADAAEGIGFSVLKGFSEPVTKMR